MPKENRHPAEGSKLQAFWKFVRANIFDLVAIALAFYFGIHKYLNPSTTIADLSFVLTGLLAVLSVMAISSLWERHYVLRDVLVNEEAMSQGISQIALEFQSYISGQVRASRLFQKEVWLDEKEFMAASTIYLSGVSLGGTIQRYRRSITQRLKEGASIRVILVDPEKPYLLEEIAVRSVRPSPKTSDEWQAKLKASIEAINEISCVEQSSGKMEIGYLPYFPSFGFHMIDPDKESGLFRVELYHHKSREENPSFILRPTDEDWYKFFRTQYDLLWTSCIDAGRVEQLPKVLAHVQN